MRLKTLVSRPYLRCTLAAPAFALSLRPRGHNPLAAGFGSCCHTGLVSRVFGVSGRSARTSDTNGRFATFRRTGLLVDCEHSIHLMVCRCHGVRLKFMQLIRVLSCAAARGAQRNSSILLVCWVPSFSSESNRKLRGTCRTRILQCGPGDGSTHSTVWLQASCSGRLSALTGCGGVWRGLLWG